MLRQLLCQVSIEENNGQLDSIVSISENSRPDSMPCHQSRMLDFFLSFFLGKSNSSQHSTFKLPPFLSTDCLHSFARTSLQMRDQCARIRGASWGRAFHRALNTFSRRGEGVGTHSHLTAATPLQLPPRFGGEEKK